MAIDNNTRTNAQTTKEKQESKEGQEDQENAAGIGPGVLGCQRRADAGIRRAKQHARQRNHEFVVRRADGDERAGPGTGDRRGRWPNGN